MDNIKKYINLRKQYHMLNNLYNNSSRKTNITILSEDSCNKKYNINDINNIDKIKNIIKSIITENYISPEFQYGSGENNSDLINHINKFFKHKYIESINGIVIFNRKIFIQTILDKMGIEIDTSTFNTIVLENKINTIDRKIKKLQKIIETHGKYITVYRFSVLNDTIANFIKQKTILLYIVDFINKNYKIFNSCPSKKYDDGNISGRKVEADINNKIIKLLKDNIISNKINCDIMYISNLDYHNMLIGMNHSSNLLNDSMNFKQEIDGLICIKLSDDSWLPIIMIETKTNINLIYNDISKLNSLHDRLHLFDNFVITDTNNIYTITGSGFKNIDIFYCVAEINDLIDGKYIQFIYNNHHFKRVIYDILMTEIKSKINNIDMFNDVEELNNYIMNILNKNSHLNNNYNLLEERNKNMRRELTDKINMIQTNQPLYTVVLKTIYSNNSYNYFNYNKNISIYKFLEKIGIITPCIIKRINDKLTEISNNFIEFNSRKDTNIVYICNE